MEDIAVTKREMKLMILRIVKTYRGNSVNKFNFLGRRPSEGDLCRELNRAATEDEKQLAAKAWDELVTSEHLRVDLQQLRQLGSNAFISAKGEYALQSGVLDALDSFLLELHPHLVQLRDGVHEALLSHASNASQQAANSAREFLNQTLRKVAPDEQVKGAHWFVDARPKTGENRPTQADKIRFALDVFEINDEDERQLIKSALKLAGDVFVGATHAPSEPSRQAIREGISNTEMAFKRMFRIAD